MDDQGDSALLFSYEIDRGKTPAFESGYKAHLQWHAEHKDHLAWYGWYVIAGSRIGAFVDGTFGNAFEAIDRRPNLPEDAKHFGENVAPYARALNYSVYELWREPSNAFTLEEHNPSKMLDVYVLDVAPAETSEFERSLISLADVPRAHKHALHVTWYRAMKGGRLPGYFVAVPRNKWGELDAQGGDFAAILRRAYGASEKDVDAVMGGIKTVSSETWLYRQDLSYFPGGS